jgi:hypothetical protein
MFLEERDGDFESSWEDKLVLEFSFAVSITGFEGVNIASGLLRGTWPVLV